MSILPHVGLELHLALAGMSVKLAVHLVDGRLIHIAGVKTCPLTPEETMAGMTSKGKGQWNS
jgi:hypothetical protein